MQNSTIQRFVLGIFAILTIWYSFYVIQPPNPKTADVPDTEFSAERAMQHVNQIAQKPHPLGTSFHDSVRTYILSELRDLGLEPEVQEGVGLASRFGSYGAYTKNIFAKVSGQNPTNTILLMAHYDTAPNAPGAADATSAIASILESVRAIKAKQSQPKNNIWILITDGEERGLLGAEYFVDNFPELDKIDLVLNFEARGSSGASMMFETSSPNGHLIPGFAQAAPNPVANSLMYTVYKLLPNDTDLSVTKRAGLNGLNFAFAEDYLNYHTIQDNPENLSRASLQHHGSNLMASLDYFANNEFNTSSNSEFVYFNNATGGLIYYPSGWSLPLAIILALLFLAYLIFLFRTNQVSTGQYLGGFGIYLLVIIIGAAITYFGWQGIKLLHPEYKWLVQGAVYNSLWYLWGFSLLNIGLFSFIYSWDWLQEKLSMHSLLAGSYTVWMLLSVGTAWYLPAASYFFTWPALMALIGWIVLGEDIVADTWKSTLILGISLSGVLFIFPPYLYLVQVMLTTEILAVSMLLLILILGLCWPLLQRIIQFNSNRWSSAFLILALSCFVIAAINSDFGPQHKKQHDINYVQNLDTQQAYWISRDHKTDSWTRQFLGDNYKQGNPKNITSFGNNLLYADAEYRRTSQPEFRVTADSATSSVRHLTMEVNPQHRTVGLRMNWESAGAISQMTIDGKEFFGTHGNSELPSGVTYFKNLTNPAEITLSYTVEKTDPTIEFTFIDTQLPTNLIPDYCERPEDMMPRPAWISNASIWKKSVRLDTLR